MKRISVNVTDEQAARLTEVQKRVGIPVSLQVRRALDDAEKLESDLKALGVESGQ